MTVVRVVSISWSWVLSQDRRVRSVSASYQKTNGFNSSPSCSLEDLSKVWEQRKFKTVEYNLNFKSVGKWVRVGITEQEIPVEFKLNHQGLQLFDTYSYLYEADKTASVYQVQVVKHTSSWPGVRWCHKSQEKTLRVGFFPLDVFKNGWWRDVKSSPNCSSPKSTSPKTTATVVWPVHY